MVSDKTKGEGRWVNRAAGAGGEGIRAAGLWDARVFKNDSRVYRYGKRII